MDAIKNGLIGPFADDAKVEILPPFEMVTISQLDYENLIRADETLKIVTELLQAEKNDYANIKPLKVVLGVAE